MQARLFACGTAAWLIGTLVLRVTGQYLLDGSDRAAVTVLCLVTMPAAAGVVCVLCCAMKVPPAESVTAAACLVVPTLLLDPFTTAFFDVVFPNIRPAAASSFAAWMLCWSGGGLVGGLLRQGGR